MIKKLWRGWIAFGHALGYVNSRIILGTLFGLAIVPVGLLMRLVGRDELKLKIDKSLKSYRVLPKHVASAKDSPPLQSDRAARLLRPF